MAAWRERGRLFWVADQAKDRRPVIAGSGLVGMDESLWIVGDDLHHLIRVARDDDTLLGEGFRIFAGDLPDDYKARKRVKPDTECLISLPGEKRRLLAFPSGSKKRRMRGSVIELSAGERFCRAREVDLSDLLHRLDDMIPGLNIEGGTLSGDKVLLLQRGNGKAGFNATIEFGAEIIEACLGRRFDACAFKPRVEEVELPKVDGVRLTFTDATACEGRIFFSAAAERGDSTYEDGAVAGSAIGWLDGDEPAILAQIDEVKLEGLTFERRDGDDLTFLTVTDADEAQTASLLLEATMRL